MQARRLTDVEQHNLRGFPSLEIKGYWHVVDCLFVELLAVSSGEVQKCPILQCSQYGVAELCAGWLNPQRRRIAVYSKSREVHSRDDYELEELPNEASWPRTCSFRVQIFSLSLKALAIAQWQLRCANSSTVHTRSLLCNIMSLLRSR